jgi:hypothetical protein
MGFSHQCILLVCKRLRVLTRRLANFLEQLRRFHLVNLPAHGQAQAVAPQSLAQKREIFVTFCLSPQPIVLGFWASLY